MAGRGISIDILANVRDALQGTGDVEKALADVEATLDDLARSGDTSADRMSRGFRDLARDADTSADRIERSYKQAYRDTARAADQAADSARASQRRLGETSAEVGQEVRQNLGEGIANAARGDFEALADTIGDTFGGAVAGIGGVATAAVAAAGALGVGALVAALSTAQEKLQESREGAIQLANSLYTNQGRIPIAERVSELIDLLGSERIATNPFEAMLNGFIDLGTNIDHARTTAERARIPLKTLIEGLSGTSLQDTEASLAAINRELERMNEESGSVDLQDWQDRKNALSSMRTELEKVVEQQQLADDLSKSVEFIDARKTEENVERGTAAIEAFHQAQETRLTQLSTLWQNAATDAAAYFTKTEEGATEFDWSAYLEDAESTIAAADELKGRLVGLPSDIRAEAERIFAAQGAVAANEYTKAYESASAADKGRFESAARANGDAAGKAQAAAFKQAFGNPIVDVTVRARRDTREWDNWVPNPKTGVVMATRARNLPDWD